MGGGGRAELLESNFLKPFQQLNFMTLNLRVAFLIITKVPFFNSFGK